MGNLNHWIFFVLPYGTNIYLSFQPKYKKKSTDEKTSDMLHMKSIWEPAFRPMPKIGLPASFKHDATDTDRACLKDKEVTVNYRIPKRSPTKRARQGAESAILFDVVPLETLYFLWQVGIQNKRENATCNCIELFSISEIISAAALEIEREEERKKLLTSYAVASSPSRKRRCVELKESHEHNSEGKGR